MTTPSIEPDSMEKIKMVPDILQGRNTIILIVTVSIIAILVAIIALGAYILYRRSQPNGEIKKVLVHNDMNDPTATVAQPAADGRVTLSKLKAHFSKPKLNVTENDPKEDVGRVTGGVTNPVYQDDRNRGVIMEEASIEQPRATGFDI